MYHISMNVLDDGQLQVFCSENAILEHTSVNLCDALTCTAGWGLRDPTPQNALHKRCLSDDRYCLELYRGKHHLPLPSTEYGGAV